MPSRHRRLAPHGGFLTCSPWTRAPILLLRRPIVFLAIVAATAVLAVAASSGVLFLSTLSTASLRAQAADDCPEASMPSMAANVPGAGLTKQHAIGTAALRDGGALGQPYWVDLARSQIQATPVTLYGRADALRHVQLLTPDTGRAGAWFPDNFAAKLKVTAGDTVVLASNNKPITVAGIYRSLSPDPFHLAHLPRYWCTWTDLIVQKLTEGGTPPLLISDPATIAVALQAPPDSSDPDASAPPDEADNAAVIWYDPIPVKSISLNDARNAEKNTALASNDYFEARATGESFPLDYDPIHGGRGAPPDRLAAEIASAEHAHDGLTGSVLPVDLAGAAVALLLVCGAGAFWAAHRSREIALLVAHGVGPGPLAMKAVVETLPAALVGLAGGLAASLYLAAEVGPASEFEPGAPARALIAAGVAVFVGLLAIGAIGALSGRDKTIGARKLRRRHLPWEFALLAVALWSWQRMRAQGGVSVDQTVIHVAPLLLLFPILGATGVLLFAGRLIALPIPRIARITRGVGRAGYLALRRIGGSRAIAIGLIVGTALPCALLAYASTVSQGVRTEVNRKYQTNLGAPQVLQMIGIRFDTPQLAGHGTAIVLYANGGTIAGGNPVEVLGVDPATFAAFAFTTADQRKDVDRLRTPKSGSAVRAVLVQARSTPDPRTVQLGNTKLAVDVVSHRDVFPGLRSPTDPLLVVNRSVLTDIDPNMDRDNEIWTSVDQVGAVSTILDHAGYSILGELDAQLRIGNTGLLPVTWIFGYLRALAILIGCVAIAGLVFALGARTRRRTVSYVMSRRMGLRQATHLRSLVIELGLVVGLGWLLGTLVGLGAYAILTGSLDLYPSLPPGAAFGVPGGTLALTAAVVAVVIALAALATHIVAERARPSDILRLE